MAGSSVGMPVLPPSVPPASPDLLRARPELSTAEGDPMPTMVGHFARFGEWARIDSIFEGRFMERIAPGAFRASFEAQTPKVLFQHGRDPQIGDKPLGPVEVLREDEVGAYYEVPLLDANYVREILPGLRAGLYGSSFRFSVDAESRVEHPGRSTYNPSGLPERTIEQATVPEFSCVTFPAYAGATAGVRSLTDWYRSGEVATRAVVWTPARRRAVLLSH
jgi:HK97 family phage prohead protease